VPVFTADQGNLQDVEMNASAAADPSVVDTSTDAQIAEEEQEGGEAQERGQ